MTEAGLDVVQPQAGPEGWQPSAQSWGCRADSAGRLRGDFSLRDWTAWTSDPRYSKPPSLWPFGAAWGSLASCPQRGAHGVLRPRGGEGVAPSDRASRGKGLRLLLEPRADGREEVASDFGAPRASVTSLSPRQSRGVVAAQRTDPLPASRGPHATSEPESGGAQTEIAGGAAAFVDPCWGLTRPWPDNPVTLGWPRRAEGSTSEAL